MTATSLALVTGANKGIGFEVARQLGTLGMSVLVGARDDERGAVAERNLRDLGVDAHHMALGGRDPVPVGTQRSIVWRTVISPTGSPARPVHQQRR
jgi:NAD(P)-dependent dehydrogenase (short-subunit alcohol dehydrogenase family)